MKRALISVYDKRGIVDFAKGLKDLDWEIISTGGTADLLRSEGIDVVEVEEITKFPEILDGRVKTLNPYIHGGILYKRQDSGHRKTIEQQNISSIDLVVNNLYPFEECLRKDRISKQEIIENIDIGGPSMIRAAAKNYEDVLVLIDPQDYDQALQAIKNDNLSLKYRRKLAGKVFSYTAHYDSLIANYFNDLNGEIFPQYYSKSYKKDMDLRYGENSHQRAAYYEEIFEKKGSMSSRKQLHGKDLSFNNINDSNGALGLLKEFEEPAIVAIKHSNPCGVAIGKDIKEAYLKAYACDDKSIFGGVIAANRLIDKAVAEEMSKIFLELILAPGFTEEALEILSKKKNIRLIEIEDILFNDYRELDSKKVRGGLLLQDLDQDLFREELEIPTIKKPSEEELEELIFAWKVAKHINSNGVVISKDKQTIGIGLGEVNRVWAVDNAIERSGKNVEGAVLASDGFFPFKDSMEIMGENKISAVIQPGGSIRDQEVIEEADRRGIAMVFTKTRHFKH